jgi:hypothetical protein
MKLRDLLVNRIAPLRQYCDRTIEMYGQTLDRLRDFLGHEPTLDDLDDLSHRSGFAGEPPRRTASSGR